MTKPRGVFVRVFPSLFIIPYALTSITLTVRLDLTSDIVLIGCRTDTGSNKSKPCLWYRNPPLGDL